MSQTSTRTTNGSAVTASERLHPTERAHDDEQKPQRATTPEYPLTSWADTPQNLVCISFLLGCLFLFGLRNIGSLLEQAEQPPSSSRWERLSHALLGPRLGLYLALQVVFHMSEYLTTAIYNPSKVKARSFLLDDKSHNAAHIFAIAEYLLEETFFPPQWLAHKRSNRILAAGLIVTLAGQYFRSLAMITAASNFSHLIVYEKAPEHSLVRTGIYGWSRHPSYFAFFYWALGTQILVANPVAFIAFFGILYKFFSHRIKVEEWYLVKFFGDDYRKYQKEVPSRIPFIP